MLRRGTSWCAAAPSVTAELSPRGAIIRSWTGSRARVPVIESLRPTRGPDHRCRVDDLAYEDVHDWWLDHQGRVPITMAHALSEHRRRHGSTFAEAFQVLVDRGAIVLFESDPV